MHVTLPVQGHMKNRTTDTLRSAFGLACEYSRNSLLPSARDHFAGETSPIRLGRVASVSALHNGSESKENGSRERGRGEKVPFFPLPLPLFFLFNILIYYYSFFALGAANDVNQCLHNQSSW